MREPTADELGSLGVTLPYVAVAEEDLSKGEALEGANRLDSGDWVLIKNALSKKKFRIVEED